VRRPGADGRIAHAVVLFGTAMVMIESEWLQATNRAPAPDGSSPVAIYLYVADVDRIVERAVAAGARVLSPPANQFWGDRTAWLLDPAGHVWTVATRVEETTEEERQARLARLDRSVK
jgi:PhnB protein